MAVLVFSLLPGMVPAGFAAGDTYTVSVTADKTSVTVGGTAALTATVQKNGTAITDSEPVFTRLNGV